ncbi:MAG TPA: GNAT family protein [Mycobacteriales bacterium]|nr:GNAT family protein [Mycobacteriales bacterium]
MSLSGEFPKPLGDGVTLELTTAAVAAEAFALVEAERERLREWLPWVDQTTDVAVQRAYLEGVERANREETGAHVTIRMGTTLAGFAELRVAPLLRSGEVGYWLSERAVGCGVMTRAVAALIDLGFGLFDLHRVQLQAATGNTRSRAVAERLGMVFEGIRREAEELPKGFVDLAVYSTLVQEWPGADRAIAQARP